MNDYFNLDLEIKEKLMVNGWNEIENKDIHQVLNAWNNDHYNIFESGRVFIKSFNNLKIYHEAYKSHEKDFSFFNAYKATKNIDPAWIFDEYRLKSKSDLLPIGLGYNEHLTYFIDPSYNFYGGFDDYFCKIGDSVNSFFMNVFFKKEFIQL